MNTNDFGCRWIHTFAPYTVHECVVHVCLYETSKRTMLVRHTHYTRSPHTRKHNCGMCILCVWIVLAYCWLLLLLLFVVLMACITLCCEPIMQRAKLHVNANRSACVCVAKLKNLFDHIHYCCDCGPHREHGGSRQPIALHVHVCADMFGIVLAGWCFDTQHGNISCIIRHTIDTLLSCDMISESG